MRNQLYPLLCALILSFTFYGTNAQEQSIKDLSFLIGKWEVREDNEEKGWWEKCTRVNTFTLDSTYIQIDASAITSGGNERTYRWYIHYNSKKLRFEMVSFFSNWHKAQFDVLSWDSTTRSLTIKGSGDEEEYHERLGVMVFEEDFNSYTWTGENKYGDPENPSIWRYVEKGKRLD